MNFVEAVTAVLKNYAGFSGRARRSEYWWFVLFNGVLSLVGYALDAAIGSPIFQVIIGLALIVPGLAVLVRRLHDTDRSGWWFLIALIPIVGAIVLLVFLATDSTPGGNRFGASPKYDQGAVGGYGTAGGYPGTPA